MSYFSGGRNLTFLLEIRGILRYETNFENSHCLYLVYFRCLAAMSEHWDCWLNWICSKFLLTFCEIGSLLVSFFFLNSSVYIFICICMPVFYLTIILCVLLSFLFHFLLTWDIHFKMYRWNDSILCPHDLIVGLLFSELNSTCRNVSISCYLMHVA